MDATWNESTSTEEVTDLAPLVRQLVTRAQGGDGDAEDRLYAVLQPPFMVIAASFLDNWHDAEDAVQLAFLSLSRNLGRLDPDRNPKAYCFEICRNASRNVKRRANRSVPGLFSDAYRDLDQDVASTTPDGATEAERRENREHADWLWQQVMRQLSDRDQRIVKMRFRENRTWTEIAGHMQMRSVGGVFARFKRLCDRVRQQFEEADP